MDGFKCPPWPDLVERARALLPIYVHWDWLAGRDCGRGENLSSIYDWWGRDDTRAVNLHLAPQCAPGRRPTESEIETMRSDIDRDISVWTATLNSAAPEASREADSKRVLLENVPWERRAEFDIPSFAVEPDEVTHWVDRYDLGFILDLAHARFAAEELRRPLGEFIARHPTSRLEELHTTGLGYDETGRRRDHCPWEPEDVGILLESLNRIERSEWPVPRVLALEYGGVGPIFEWRSDPAVIEDHACRLAAWLRERGLRDV